MSNATNATARIAATPSRKVERRQNATRDRILVESARLFLARGFAAVSVDQVVEAAEIARSSFYRFFPNREEVLSSIIRPVFENGIGMMREVATHPPRQVLDGVFSMYLQLWSAGPESLQLATRMGGAYFRLFEDVHHAYREALTALMRRVEPTGLLLNGSGENSARLIARTAVPVLEVYRGDPRIESLFRQTMSGLLVKPEARP